MRCTLILALLPLNTAACLAPSFTPSEPPPDGPALIAAADIDDDGRGARVRIEGRDVGDVFGASFHVVVDRAILAEARVSEALAGALDRTMAAVDGTDAAFGGTRFDPAAGDTPLPNDTFASFTVTVKDAGDHVVRIDDPVLRRADGSFLPCTAIGGVLTLEASR
jgi:hypothetical protein